MSFQRVRSFDYLNHFHLQVRHVRMELNNSYIYRHYSTPLWFLHMHLEWLHMSQSCILAWGQNESRAFFCRYYGCFHHSMNSRFFRIRSPEAACIVPLPSCCASKAFLIRSQCSAVPSFWTATARLQWCHFACRLACYMWADLSLLIPFNRRNWTSQCTVSWTDQAGKFWLIINWTYVWWG